MEPGKIHVAECRGAYLIKLTGDVRLTCCPALDSFMQRMFTDRGFRSVLIDLSHAQNMDSTALGHLAKIAIQARKKFKLTPVLFSTNADINRIIESMGFEALFSIRTEPLSSESDLAELPMVTCSEESMKNQVIEAHRILMGMNDENHARFQELVDSLKKS
jgi:anti-anti-sigma factor